MLIQGTCALPGGRIEPATLRFDGATLVGVRPPRAGDPPPVDGLLVPGLVNAHTHLELSFVGLVPGGEGLPAWVERQIGAREGVEVGLGPARRGARELARLGVAAACDVGSSEGRGAALAAAGVSGIAAIEQIGLDAERAERGIAATRRLGVKTSARASVMERATAHAPYSTHPEVARACAGWPSPRSTVHLAEDPAEDRFLRDRDGPWAELLDRFGVAWRDVAIPGSDPIAWLRAVGLLDVGALVVHGVTLGREGLAALAQAGAPLCLCVRSNLHIHGRVPDLHAAVELGVPLAIGTDGLVSCPDLDVLAELPVLAALAPDVPVATWLIAATEGGARALGAHGMGALTPGTRPGLLQLDTDLAGLAVRAPARRWLVLPGPPLLEPLEAA